MDQMMLMGLMDQETSLGGPDPISRCRTKRKVVEDFEEEGDESGPARKDKGITVDSKSQVGGFVTEPFDNYVDWIMKHGNFIQLM